MVRIRISKSNLTLVLVLVTFSLASCQCGIGLANDRIKRAVERYQRRVEEERARVIEAFGKELKSAQQQKNYLEIKRIEEAKQAWMNQELIVSERGGLRFFNNVVESFTVGDFELGDGFSRKGDAILADTGTATLRLNKPAVGVCFRGLVESKNNFIVQFNSENLDPSRDLAITFGGWNNSRTEMRLDNQPVVAREVGMPPRWLCEITYHHDIVTVYANGAELMSTKLERPLAVNLINVAVSYESKTVLRGVQVKVK